MSKTNGTILDATALISFYYLKQENHWPWLERTYAPLFVAQEVMVSDRLSPPIIRVAQKNLMALTLDGAEEFQSFNRFLNYERSLSPGDSSTLALARWRHLLCITDDYKMYKMCKNYKIEHCWTLDVLRNMIITNYQDKNKVLLMGLYLFQGRYLDISDDVFDQWKKSL